MSRWSDHHPHHQGVPPLDSMVQFYSPQLPPPGRADRDVRRSLAWGLEHRNDPNPDARFSEFIDAVKEVYIDHRPQRPIMAGQAYDTSTYDTTYGLSAPQAFLPYQKSARNEVINSRLADIDPHHLYSSIKIPRKTKKKNKDEEEERRNTLGACCEFVTLQRYFQENEGSLRTIRATAREIEKNMNKAFCPNCRDLAKKAANQFSGLRIIDAVSGKVYESKNTATAFATREAARQYQQQQLAMQQQAAYDQQLAQQMSQLSVVPQTIPTVVQYYAAGQGPAQSFPVAGPSNVSHQCGSSKKKSKRAKTATR
ncbi:hypothetical protein DFH06DRAFT_1192175 [Mycena polygramma]|nr:hypothetical protein DFH06DRAFT_1192175 [Mycena polygramma]